MDTGRPDELTLHAFMDGELAPAQAAEVAGWLADHPFEAARVAALQEQKSMLQALHADVLDEPVPLNLARAVRRPRTQWHWPHAVAAALMLAVGVGVGYGMGASQGLGLGTGLGDRTQGQGLAMTRNGGAPAPLPTFVRDAAAAHVVFAPEQRHPVEVAAQQQEHLVQWLSKRLGVKLTAPSLDAQGFRLMGGRLLPGEQGQARAQFMYEDAHAERLTLYVSLMTDTARTGTAPVAFQWTEDGATRGFYWINGDRGYALSASLPREQLHVVAEAIYRQLQ